ncbi:hypothetical protein [Burkholderia gladioli]|uniref:hypothetical protein n=1 Tax=Burkholderia gladioli TaxID=28095 RepID=UPI0016422180|nr:hypothetical protein [Burkholderia gladioli]
MTNEFDAERARLAAELTQLALAGSNTAKVREKLAALDEREQAARDAEQAAAAERRKEREMEAVRAASVLATEAAFRLTDAGYEVGPNDAEQLALMAAAVTRNDADIAEAEAGRAAAFRAAMDIATRIDLLNARAAALQELRLTGQATPRDLAEAETIRADLAVLEAAYARAETAAQAITVPSHMLEHRQRALGALHAFEASIARRILEQRVADAENAFLDAVRALLVGTGAHAAAGTYRRGAAFDAFVRYGAL